MHRIVYLTLAVAGLTAGGSGAWAAMCKAERLTCATRMPVGGYCECTARGTTESGTVVAQPDRRRPVDSTAGGCGANPQAPGCR